MNYANDLESRLTFLETKDDQRDKDISDLKDDLSGLVRDVGSIKKALWVLAGIAASNVPMVQEVIKHII